MPTARVFVHAIDDSWGDFQGVINTQVFGNGDGANDIRNTYTISGVGTFSPDGGGVTNACGCTDDLATKL